MEIEAKQLNQMNDCSYCLNYYEKTRILIISMQPSLLIKRRARKERGGN